MKGITLRIEQWSGGDVGYECLIALSLGVCAAAIVGLFL